MTDINPDLLLFLLIAGILLLFFIRWQRQKKTRPEYRINAVLRPYREGELRQCIIPDGIGGLVEIERLIQLRQGLLIIETCPLNGNIFGADKIDQWTQIKNGKRYTFTNPLYHIRHAKLALKALVPHVRVYCRLVFTGDASFPKGQPAEVSTLETLDADLASLRSTDKMDEQTRAAWRRIERIARIDEQAARKTG